MKGWAWPFAITVATGVGLFFTRDKKTIRYIGDRAEVGDEVAVPVASAAALAQLAALGKLFTPTTTAYGLTVVSVGPESVVAVPVAIYAGPTRLPVPATGSLEVPKNVISAVYRNGVPVAL